MFLGAIIGSGILVTPPRTGAPHFRLVAERQVKSFVGAKYTREFTVEKSSNAPTLRPMPFSICK